LSQVGHVRYAYTEEMAALEHDLLEMGSRTERMVSDAVQSLVTLDSELAMNVVRRDDEIDEQDFAIEALCLRLLALQQPIARDLRVVGTAMKMITDIERVADLAVDIAKIGMKIEKEFGEPNVVDIPRMGNIALDMLRKSMKAFVGSDLELVGQVCRMDEEVDDLYRTLRGQLFHRMRSDNTQVVACSWLLLAIHHIERIADHAVNIAERVHFMVTGEVKNLAASHRNDPPSAAA